MRSQHTDPHYLAQEILARRDHSETELRRKLQKKGVGPEDIDETVSWLKSKQLLDDHAFARMYIESILRQKPVGPRWLSAKLYQKGVKEDVTASALDAAYQPGEAHYAHKAARLWARLHPTKNTKSPKLWRHLASRGFSSSVIQSLDD